VRRLREYPPEDRRVHRCHARCGWEAEIRRVFFTAVVKGMDGRTGKTERCARHRVTAEAASRY
jgi:hypothetical protein